MTQTNHADMHTGHRQTSRTRTDRGHVENVVIHQSHPQRARFRLEGVSSSFDAARLEHRLERQVGVIGAAVNPITKCAHVAFDPALTTPSRLSRQIELCGFHVKR